MHNHGEDVKEYYFYLDSTPTHSYMKFLYKYPQAEFPYRDLDHPFVFDLDGQRYEVQYLPAESDSDMFGGNSNWRGPVWIPVNTLLIRGLLEMYPFYGDDFKVECPTDSGKYMTLFEAAKEIARRLSTIFLRDASGRRPVFGGTKKLQEDPHRRDYILFYEYSMATTALDSEQATRPGGPE